MIEPLFIWVPEDKTEEFKKKYVEGYSSEEETSDSSEFTSENNSEEN